MILGAGLFQLAAIRKAAALGWHVTTVDYLPENVAHRFGHRYVNCSTTDREAVRAAAERLEIDGIFSMASDVAVPTVAHVAAALGLPGPSEQAAESLTGKHQFRRLQASSGLEHPRWCEGTSLEEVGSTVDLLAETVVVKPVDTSGSRGVAVVDRRDGEALEAAFAAAAGFSRSGRVCVEEYIEGTDVSADGLVLDGEIAFVRFTEKFSRDFVVLGHRLPGPLTPREEGVATAALARHCRAAGYDDGPFDADLRVGGGRAVVLEMSPRLGGNGMPLVIAHHTGVDLVELALKLAMGETAQVPDRAAASRGCGVRMLAADRPGRVVSMATGPELKQALPAVASVELAVAAGAPVNAHRHGGDVFGYAVFDCRSRRDYRQRIADLYSALRLQIEPST